MKILSLQLINWYQGKGGSNKLFKVECNFIPSCSQYTKEAIEKYGFTKGWKLGISRIRRCSEPDIPHKIEDPIP